jgi:hypothetical protein
VDKHSELQLITDYNRVHPPLDPRGIPSSFHDEVENDGRAGGGNERTSAFNTYNPNTHGEGMSGFAGSSREGLFPADDAFQQGSSGWATGHGSSREGSQDGRRRSRRRSDDSYVSTKSGRDQSGGRSKTPERAAKFQQAARAALIAEDDLYDASGPEDGHQKILQNNSNAAPDLPQNDLLVEPIEKLDGTKDFQNNTNEILEEIPKVDCEEAIAERSEQPATCQPTLLPDSSRDTGEKPGIESTVISRSSSQTSLFSLQSLIFSGHPASSMSSISPYPDNGARLLKFLSSDSQLQALFNEAARKVSLDRFEKNFRRCLQLFSEHLRIEGKRSRLLRDASTVVRHFSTNAAHLIRRSLENRINKSIEFIQNQSQEIENFEDEDDADDEYDENENFEDNDGLEEESIPDLELALYESNSFQMLRDNLRLFLSPRPAERAVFEAWPPDQSRSLPDELIHHVEWELVRFLDTNYEQGQALGRILTLSGQDDDAQASTCKEYLTENWPEAGPLLLAAIEEYFTIRNGGKRFIDPLYHFSNDLERVSIRAFLCPFPDEGGTTTSKKFHIIVKAKYTFQVQMTTAISWLCATCRQSPYDNIFRSSVAIKSDDAPDKKQPRTVDYTSKTIRYSLLDLEPVASNKACWHGLFPRGVVAYGFPTRPRNEGMGLDIDFPEMMIASRCLSFVEYDCGLIAHGLTSLLIPIKQLLEDDGVQWHFENKAKQFPNRLCRVSEIMRFNKFKEWYRELYPENLATRRCFVGLAKSADVVIGTKGYQTDFGLSAAARPTNSTVMHVNAQSFAVGPGYFEFTSSFGHVVRFPTSSQPVTYARFDQDICDVLASGRDHLVLLYDTKNEIGWYLPQASVVLHMAHAKMSMRKYQLYDGDRMLSAEDSTGFSRLSFDGWAEASDAIKMSLRLKVRKHYCSITGPIEEYFGDFIRKIWHTLDDVEAYLGSKEPQFQHHAPHCIHGVEYVHAVNEEGHARMHIKEAIVDQAWAHLTSLEPIVIFTKDIQPPIGPDTSNLCKSWMNVPSGQKYLVVMGTAAQTFLDRQNAGIAEGVSWEFGQELIQSHQLGSNTPIFHVQKLRVTHKPRPNEPISAALAGNTDCCLVFGNDSEKECLEALDNPEPSSPEEISIKSATRLDGSVFDLSSPVDEDTADGGNSSTSELSQDTYQPSVFDASILLPPIPESSPPAVIRLQKVEEDCGRPSIYTLSKSSQGALVEMASAGLSSFKKWRSRGKSTKPSSTGQVRASGSPVPRVVTAEALPKKLDLERRRIEDDPNRIEGKRRENINTAKRERS